MDSGFAICNVSVEWHMNIGKPVEVGAHPSLHPYAGINQIRFQITCTFMCRNLQPVGLGFLVIRGSAFAISVRFHGHPLEDILRS